MTDEKTTTDSRSRLAKRRGLEPHVYQPAEDSALLARAVIESLSVSTSNEEPASDSPIRSDSTARRRLLEIGTGSGWVAEQLATKTGSRVVASDINPHACAAARDRGVEVVRADLLAGFADRSVDYLVFNPPYLPTDPDNEWDDWMEHALSGGTDGRRLIVPFLDDAPRVLTSGGAAFLLVSSLTGYDAVVDYAREVGFVVDEVAQESYPFEVLSILRLTHPA